jgi:hypothetical protein
LVATTASHFLPALLGAFILIPSFVVLIKFDVIACKFLVNLTVKSFIHKLLVGVIALYLDFIGRQRLQRYD